MTDVRIDVYRDGEYVKTIERRLREENGCPMVRFRGVNYPVVDACEIHIEDLSTEIGPQGSGELDAEQRAVVQGDAEARLIINAGPGMGKTRVACARVAELIRTGVEPSNIWIISFTRTAVSEVRDRIRLLASEDDQAASVKVTTLDSHAWYFREGFEEKNPNGAFSGFEENISRAIEVLRKNDSMVQEYLETLQHVVIDEAQDLVGVRAEMLELLIRRIPPSCGVSVFTDDAQAIYGFSEADEDDAEDDRGTSTATLPERLRREGGLGFESVELRTVHRTNSRRLKRLFTETRQLVLEPGDAAAKLQRIRVEIESSADEVLDEVPAEEMLGRDDLLVLFRRRAEVLLASARLWRGGVSHRIRMSGYPPTILPWVAALLWDFTERHLRRAQFNELWADRIAGTGHSRQSPDDAWTLMWRAAGASGGRVEMRRLRAQLSRGQPPLGFVSPDIGAQGPILGTIHASKGREAPYVDLMLPPEQTGYGDLEEESRVLFVGATRGREGLRVGKAPWCSARSLESRRVFQLGSGSQAPRVRIEVGRAGDLDEAMLVSDRLYASDADVEEAQDLLRRGILASFDVVAQQEPGLDYSYILYANADGRRIALGGLQNSVKQDLWSLSKLAATRQGVGALKPPPKIPHIRVVGVRTVVLPEDHPELTGAHPPYDETGIFLAPVVCGFPVAFFRRRY